MRYTWAKAFREAIADTGFGMLINIPLNYLLIKIAFWYEMDPWQITIFFTACFTVVALVRKTMVRMDFDKKHHDNLEKQAGQG